ncbi:MAG: hypothetical protein ABIJ82_00965 [Patescibacteria group bacterium]
MINAFKEGIREAFRRKDKALTSTQEVSVGPVDEERLWISVAKRVVACMKDGGFYFETEETPPPFKNVEIGVFCGVAVVDKTGVNYEAGLKSIHYPEDKGELQNMQISHRENNSHVYVTVTFRSEENMIRLSPDSAVEKHRWISSYPRELDLNEKLQLLSKLSEVVVDERKTLELFNYERGHWGHLVAWIKDMPLLPGVLE